MPSEKPWNDAVLFTDSNFANLSLDGRSFGGFILFMGGPILWRSAKQSIIATSTADAELYETCRAAIEAIWFSYLFEELNLKRNDALVLLQDNQAVVDLYNNTEAHKSKLRHAIRRLKALAMWRDEGIIHMVKVASKDNLADILTKQLPKRELWRLMDAIYHWNGPKSLEESV